MDVLIIGGTRFLGPLLVFRLLAEGHRVTILNRGTRPDPFGAFVHRVEGLVADRRSPALAKALLGRSFDAVVDFAAYEQDDVAGAIRALSGRIGHYILISTGQVYLARESCPRPSAETDYFGPLLPRPTTPAELDQWAYGIGKRACEDELIGAWQKDAFPSTRIRIPIVNGERDYHRRIESYLFRLLDGSPLLMPDGGHQRTRHVYGGEVVRAIASILGKRETFGEAYNLSQDETPTVAELCSMLAEMLGSSPRFVPVTAETLERHGLVLRDVSPFSSRWASFLDPHKSKTELGFSHAPLREYLTRIVASFLAYPSSDPPPGYDRRAEEIAVAKSGSTIDA